ncbi:hypothetical protein [Streptomyces sp. SID8499]|uniref:hypothetical protein n=1 Tax=Streptomyces sp. SID8499 TaxID=2706106 RepID=UPI0013CD48F7|nr:hypothetical protein [Streptomyces sp. SID8499]NED31083.1 hypothetical protein [Streptomyces sp. SID8499]
MSRSMDRICREAMEQYGAAPADALEALVHVLKVHSDEPDSRLMIEATNGIYGNGVRTGLTMGDLREIAARLGCAP